MKPIFVVFSVALLAAGCVDDNYDRGGRYHRGANNNYSPQACDTWRRQARNGNQSARNLYDRNCRSGRGGGRYVDNNNKSPISPRACAAWRDLARQGNPNAVTLYNANCRNRY